MRRRSVASPAAHTSRLDLVLDRIRTNYDQIGDVEDLIGRHADAMDVPADGLVVRGLVDADVPTVPSVSAIT